MPPAALATRRKKASTPLKERRKSEGFDAPAKDVLGIYLSDAGAHPLLKPEEEQAALRRLLDTRGAWVTAFLGTEPGLEKAWEDLQAWAAGDLAASSLIPGPPKLKDGQIGPADHVRRLFDIFDRHVKGHPDQPFSVDALSGSRRLLRVLMFAGLRPGPLSRYEEHVRKVAGRKVARTIDSARKKFIAARTLLIERNLRLVLKVAKGFMPCPLPFGDLIQEGNMGLIRATESFNGRFGVRFSTYAYLWIRQGILRALENKSRTIRLPVNLTQFLRKSARETEGDEPSETATGGKSSNARLQRLMTNPTVSGPVLSLNVGPDETSSLVDTLADPSMPAAHATTWDRDLSQTIGTALDLLAPRPRLILRLRYGIGCPRCYTLSEIGVMLGLSAERIRQIQEEAHSTLRAGPFAVDLKEMVLN